MIKRMSVMLVIVGVIFAGLYGFQVFKASMIKKVVASFANPTQTVGAETAVTTEWRNSAHAIGTFRAINGADLALEVGGIVSELHFSSGDTVEAGQILLQLRSDDDQAKLDSLEATANLNAVTLKRDQEQFKFKAVSQATLDSDEATLKTAIANAAQQKAILVQKTLRAPFSGRLGIRQIDLGQYLSAGTTIVTLQAFDPIFIDFYLPQQALSQVRVGQTTRVDVDTYQNTPFIGTIVAINSKVDASSRNVQIRASLKNGDFKLVPGMYATVDLETGTPQKFVTLPQTAIYRNSYGDTVFVLDKAKDSSNLAARQVLVKAGDRRGDQVAILSGVNDGESVVVTGQIKLHNGSPVRVDNSALPLSDKAPMVSD